MDGKQGYLAVPSDSEGPGVLVLHPWWGLNDVVKEVCDRLAGEGFTAFAPDLYHGKVAMTIAEAEALSAQLDDAQANADVAAAADLLCERVGQDACALGVIGFSLGAYYALELADRDPDLVRAVVLFYGTGRLEHDQSKAAYLGHFAENDPYESPEYVDALEVALSAAGRPVTFHRYEGLGHWFFERDRDDAYSAPAAQLAWERTMVFLKAELGPW